MESASVAEGVLNQVKEQWLLQRVSTGAARRKTGWCASGISTAEQRWLRCRPNQNSCMGTSFPLGEGLEYPASWTLALATAARRKSPLLRIPITTWSGSEFISSLLPNMPTCSWSQDPLLAIWLTRLRATYEAVPSPKLVVAVGACGCSGGIFANSHAVVGAVDAVIPVDGYIPVTPRLLRCW